MREVFFILVVIVVLLGLTAFRYRKQIRGMLEIARALKKVGGALSQGNQKNIQSDSRPGSEGTLVNCSTCGVWSPQTRARQLKGRFYCSDECVATRVG